MAIVEPRLLNYVADLARLEPDQVKKGGRGPAPHLGYATWFGQRHMFVGTMSMRTIVPRKAPAVLWREVNLRQGSQMASQLELSARAALCRQLAKREPTNRVLWMAEAENWWRLSNEELRAEPEQKSVTAS